MDSRISSLKDLLTEICNRPRVRAAMLLFIIAIFTMFLINLGVGLQKNFSEQANMAAVNKRIPPIKTVLGADGKFVGVTFHASSWSGGSLLISGIVASEADLATLKTAVSAGGVALPVTYQVAVLSALQKKLEKSP